MYSLKNLWGEPVAVWATIQAVVVALISFGWLEGIGLSNQDDMAAVVAVISALSAIHLALFTHKTILAPLTQLVQAVVALLAIYGTHFSAENTALLVGAITAVAAAWHRERQVPLTAPSLALTIPPEQPALPDAA